MQSLGSFLSGAILRTGIQYISLSLVLIATAYGDNINNILSEENARFQREFNTFQQEKHTLLPTDEVVEEKHVPADDKKVIFKEIQLGGATLLSSEEKKKLVEPYLNHEITLKDIQNLIRNITNLYLKKGYTTTRVYLGESSFSGDKLVLYVVEGKIEKLTILENGKERKKCNTVLHGLEGIPFQIREIEQGLDRINRLPSMDAHMEVEGTPKPGYSIVKVEVKKKRPFTLGANFDNHGTSSTGENNPGMNISLDDIIGLYDSWNITHRRNRELYKYSGKYSESTTGMFSIPWNEWLLSGAVTQMDYLTTAGGRTPSIGYTGTSQIFTADLERAILREFQGRTSISVGFAHKRTRTFLRLQGSGIDSVTPITNQTYNLSSLQLKLAHMERLLGGVFSSSISYLQGIKLLGSKDDSNRLPGGPKALFSKWTGDIGYVHPVNFLSPKLNYKINASGQYAPQRLYSNERLTLGGYSTIRGFQDGCLSGETGGYIRNELSYQLPRIKEPLGQPEVFFTFDVGKIFRDLSFSTPNQEGLLLGGACGLRFRGEHLNGELIIAQALRKPESQATRNLLIGVQVGCTF